MARVARTSGPSMGPLHVQLYTERSRCSGHQETSGSNAAASALKSGGIAGTLLDVAMISCRYVQAHSARFPARQQREAKRTAIASAAQFGGAKKKSGLWMKF